MTQEAHLDRIGERYRLVEQLGSGGFGRVWKAHDEVLGVDVAVKEVRVPPTASDEERAEFLARARREARNAARLRDHPNIVPVHDVVTVDEVPWIVMRLVDGHSLEDRLKDEGPVSADEAVKIAKALLKALDAAHTAGVVHRDVKPANVMMTRDGEALLTDFGIAVHRTDTALTASGAVVGSMEYLAPERLNGKGNGTAGDLFSLGVTLYRCVEGVSPFRRETVAETVTALLRDDPPPPENAGRLSRLITGLLGKDPETRPTAAEALKIIDRPREPDDPTARLRPPRRPDARPSDTRRRTSSRPTPRTRRRTRKSRRRISRGMVVLCICMALPIAFLCVMGTYFQPAYRAEVGGCVHPGGPRWDGAGTWRKQPCSVPLPWQTSYRVVERSPHVTSCDGRAQKLVLHDELYSDTVTACVVPIE